MDNSGSPTASHPTGADGSFPHYSWVVVLQRFPAYIYDSLSDLDDLVFEWRLRNAVKFMCLAPVALVLKAASANSSLDSMAMMTQLAVERALSLAPHVVSGREERDEYEIAVRQWGEQAGEQITQARIWTARIITAAEEAIEAAIEAALEAQ